jgi:hypothetical protein
MIAIILNKVEIVKLLAKPENKADPNNKETQLMIAIKWGNNEIVKLLAKPENKADPNI